MTIVSIRLPEDLEIKLEREARLMNRPRSEIARDAIAGYLEQAERERFLARLEAAARSLASDIEARGEVLAVAESLLPLENEALALGEPVVPYRITFPGKKSNKGKR